MKWPWRKKRAGDERPESHRSGVWGERRAAEFLRRKGFRVIGTRVKVGTRDEFDVVARDGQVLVFVEVKTRRSEVYGRPMDAVDHGKRHVLSRAAVRYVQSLKRKQAPPFRFDVVEIVGRTGDPDPIVRHIENAFPLDSCYMVP